MTLQDKFLTLEDMPGDLALIRATSLSGYPQLVTDLHADPLVLLRAAGIRPSDVGREDAFFTYRSFIDAVESAAVVTGTRDFGRRLASRQGIGILGPLGVAIRTAPTVHEAFATMKSYLAAYSPAITLRVDARPRSTRARIEFEILLRRLPPHAHTIELSLGFGLQLLRLLLGSSYLPLQVHLPHEALTPRADYVAYFGCRPRFAEPWSGFSVQAADLARPLDQDQITHQALRDFLAMTTPRQDLGVSSSVRELVATLLPAGAATRDVIAQQLAIHPRTLQRRLEAEGTSFAELVDQVRRDRAERYLRDTEMSLGHLARELGYSEQSALTRSSRRWFGAAPGAYRRSLRPEAGGQTGRGRRQHT